MDHFLLEIAFVAGQHRSGSAEAEHGVFNGSLTTRPDVFKEIGEVLGFQNFGAGDLIEIKRDRSRSSFLPFTNDMVPVVDTDEGRVVLSEVGIAVLAADDGEKQEKAAP